MERPKHDAAATSREDDFRDYEERDIDGGWPYADEDASGKPGNAGYGASESNFDRASAPPAEIADEPVIDSTGGPVAAPSSVDPAIDDDALGERIAAALEDNGLDQEVLTITVHDSVAELSGRVDTDEEKNRLIRVAIAVPGVRNIIDGLTLSGVDSHIPSDVTE
jgi:HSP20 family molecular chaperone IbpA